jgi:hypothetical protein
VLLSFAVTQNFGQNKNDWQEIRPDSAVLAKAGSQVVWPPGVGGAMMVLTSGAGRPPSLVANS